jgi:two-component system chemotaxis sensor kinase CheA
MESLLNEFLTETNESLATLDLELVRLEQDRNDGAILGNIFRLMHTIKGTCGFLGLPRLESVAHAGENVLGKFRDGELLVTPGAVTLILKCIDQIRVILAELEAHGAEPQGDDKILIAEINAMATGTPPASRNEEAFISAAQPMFEDAGFPVAAELLLEVEQAMACRDAVPEAACAGAAVPTEQPSAVPAEQPSAVPAEQPSAVPAEQKESSLAAASIRVNVGVIENLMTLISELVLTRNQLLQASRTQNDTDFKVPLQRLSHITSDLQEGVTRMRMQPIGNAWAKLPRIVRDLTVESGKKIQLVTQGAETELDRQVLELIKDPLTHMIRNSADHGIEGVSDRLAAGKPETGTITLQAYHESGHIVIRLADDGRGLDADRIRRKALANGLATEAELAAMPEQQVLQFIFNPGFSTAEKVTSVSGRGVGMDVVRTNIEKIGGAIDMKSAMGKGTEFIIKIPLTLAIIAALIVETGKQRFAIPQISVVELVRVSQKSGTRIEMVNDSAVLRLRDRLLPLVSLSKLLDMDPIDGAATQDQFIVVAQVGAQTFGIVVDRVFDTEEIVVKPVSRLLRGIGVYAGNTILGDGSVIMILDPNGMAGAAGQLQMNGSANADTAMASAQELDRTSFLLFRAEGEDLKAVPLELVARIEEFDTAKIERTRGQHVVQYRGHLMPLVPFDTAHVWKTNGKQPVLVFADGDRSMGLVIDEIVDIVQDRMVIELESDREGLIGGAVIAGRATDVIDIAPFLTRGFADWFDEPLPESAKSETRKREALLVDDSPFFRNLLAPLLAAAGWQVTAAPDGIEALKLRDAGRKFDLIISDVDMPNMDGLALAGAVRSDPTWQDTPMIALSARMRPIDVAAGTQAGFDQYIGKSNQGSLARELTQAIANVTGGRPAEAPQLRKAS